MKEYKNREYCRDVACGEQIDIDYLETMKEPSDEVNKEIKYIKEEYCSHCQAYKFHQWLNDNGYKILKEGEDG